MNEGLRETIGFICRWCLLGIAWATVLLVLGAGMSATASAGDELAAEMIVADAIWQHPHSRRPCLGGYLNVSVGVRTSSLALCYGPADSTPAIVTVAGGRFYPGPIRPVLGENRLVVKGLPYGLLAFRKCEATLVLVPESRRVFFLDARTALNFHSEDAQAYQQCLHELRRRGEAVLFHPGPLDQFLQDRRRIRRFDILTPVLCEVAQEHNPMVTLWNAAGGLNRRKRRNCTVITDDASLAGLAVASRFNTHLVSGEEANVTASVRLRVHESLAKFKEYMAKLPIAR